MPSSIANTEQHVRLRSRLERHPVPWARTGPGERKRGADEQTGSSQQGAGSEALGQNLVLRSRALSPHHWDVLLQLRGN